MNLMFRKNMREGGGRSGGGGSKSKMSSRHQRKARESYGGPGGDEYHYRTHIFFSPAHLKADNEELRCTPISGFQFPPQTPPVSSATGTTAGGTGSSITGGGPDSGDGDAPPVQMVQPLVDRRPSSNLILDHPPRTTTTTSSLHPLPPPPRRGDHQHQHQHQHYHHHQHHVGSTARQVSFGGQPGSGGFVSSRSEPISLATLDKDCFIIPVHSLDRFLPAGIPLPTPETTDASQQGPLSVLEVSDPKICILAHLMSPLEPIEPLLESPLAHPLSKQRAVASELLNEVQQGNNAVGGMLLANMERSSAEFPFIAYYVINTTQTDPALFYSGVRGASLSKFEPKNTRYTAAHTLDLYSEVASICRPPLALAPNEVGSVKKGQTPSTGYIISVYKVYEGDDGERFERNWLYWTGARMIYRYLPKTAGLRRITLHKSVSSRGDKMYLLICECADLLKDLSAAALLIPALRARLCGYTGLYRPIQTF
ncbi:uncharacterized protein LOC6042946 isoform X1 [Culex quinquefasciatus]|uniref:uncharacterized protein LOC6042946 isoform X1 n=1 Tax=Culex quinquefasciatus TaxID=7176 RepID=UPI0018E3DBB8|nr:uncharacterized protein LOC6042946 isoform X1 [Culex quinquefasciatus]